MTQQGTLDLVEVLTPSALNRKVRLQLESNYASVWVEGEISNLSQPSSGHSYFSLKDDNAQLRCALFRQHRLKLRFRLEPGAQVRVHGRLSLYEARGDYQLIADRVEAAGEGRLLQQFEALKRRLAGEGLFDPSHKQSLPRFPNRIAVVSSPSGAAIKDVLSVLQRRYPSLHVTLVPTLVQGSAAPDKIVRALEAAAALQPQLILLTRGGGSIEDLWAFNDEAVARAIFASESPVVAAIGHEVDSTIADFVADASAVTPSAGAEMITPDRDELLQRLAAKERTLRQLQGAALRAVAQRLDRCEQALSRHHPGRGLQRNAERLAELRARLPRLMSQRQATMDARLRLLWSRLQPHQPQQRLQLAGQRLAGLQRRLRLAGAGLLREPGARIGSAAGSLQALSPLAVLDRGYSLTTTATGAVVLDSKQVRIGDVIRTRLARGEIESTVSQNRCEPDEAPRDDD